MLGAPGDDVIPDGHFVPAETRGSLHGAWLQTTDDGLLDRDLPTWPIPDFIRLAGADVPVLAYSGTIVVLIALDVAPGITGDAVGLRIGYELCDQTACGPFQVQQVRTPTRFDDPPPPDGFLAFRQDPSSVVIAIGRDQPLAKLSFHRLPIQFALPVAELPADHSARAEFTGDVGIGSRWVVASPSAGFAAIADRPVGFEDGCGDAMPLGLSARVTDLAFEADRAKYLLALPAGSSKFAHPGNSAAVSLQLNADQRARLETVIDKQMRITMPSLFAPDPRGALVKGPPAETSYQRRVREGQGRLMYHLEAFKLAPDTDVRLYVRAYWALDGAAQTGLTLWLRFDGSRFIVERSNAGVSRMAQFREMRIFGPNIAEQPGHAGMLLNVIPAPDGWAYIIMAQSGYESSAVTVYKYSPYGPVETGIVDSHGC
jgi:hypothetical protein